MDPHHILKAIRVVWLFLCNEATGSAVHAVPALQTQLYKSILAITKGEICQRRADAHSKDNSTLTRKT